MLEIALSLDIFLKVIQNLILPELEPKHVDGWVRGVHFFNSPPRAIVSEDSLDERTIVSLAHI